MSNRSLYKCQKGLSPELDTLIDQINDSWKERPIPHHRIKALSKEYSKRLRALLRKEEWEAMAKKRRPISLG